MSNDKDERTEDLTLFAGIAKGRGKIDIGVDGPVELFIVFNTVSPKGEVSYFAMPNEALNREIGEMEAGTYHDPSKSNLSLSEAFRGVRAAKQALEDLLEGKISGADLPDWSKGPVSKDRLYRPKAPGQKPGTVYFL